MDASSDAPLDACRPTTTIDTTLTKDLGGFMGLSARVDGYPRVESFVGDTAAVLLPVPDSGPVPIDAGPDADGGFAIKPLEIFSARSGLWWPTPVATSSFDVDVDVKLQCTSS